MLETLAIIIGVSLLAAACVVVKHRFWPPDPDDEPREDVAEYISMMVGVLYALVLGLALVSVWDTRSAADEHTQTEASAAHQVRLLSDGLPQRQAREVRSGIEAYVSHVVDVEFPAMAAGDPLGQRGWDLLSALRHASRTAADATPSQHMTAQEVLAQLGTLDDARRGRESDADGGLAPALWVGLIMGGVLTVAFMFMFGVERSYTHVVMVMGLSALITFMVLLIHELDRPFTGMLAVDATPFTRYF
ncbi:DUF4239 domain-containing protein [Streptomyces spectabilis]|uniref:DUF4239 domain-containing protein n=1 Tax=Streptomyces spectabilis TaxID=68270 RepID=A0A5P2XLV9_STRST|nr:DUF4239 domain-containing protein [Streptomyces spectabilis]MBB5105406.1 hypothetical protein [Streptomyces spectabilis]MCI3906599.1 DUF4239 domain-containing protein [Streptomyces spectabilis]QEV63422.1 DUF4239 domain-containing protein [Streptomyces spectabilis]GGV21385.1 membrane protein [Streptomyces spectabilis]